MRESWESPVTLEERREVLEAKQKLVEMREAADFDPENPAYKILSAFTELAFCFIRLGDFLEEQSSGNN